MPPTSENAEDVSPYKLLQNFSKSRLLWCLFLALLIHVAVIGGLSTNYIYRTWIDPKPDLPQPEAAANADDAETSPDDGATENLAADAKAPGSAEKTASTDDASDATQDVPVVNRVTEKADPGQIPQEPGGLGLPIDEVKD